jgi:hypothetical protein
MGKGFKAVAGGIAAKQGIPIKNADAILAAGTRKSSQAAVNSNPSLSNIPGTKKPTTGSVNVAKAASKPPAPKPPVAPKTPVKTTPMYPQPKTPKAPKKK